MYGCIQYLENRIVVVSRQRCSHVCAGIIILSGDAAPAAPYFLDEIHTRVNHHTFRYPIGEEFRIELSGIATLSVVLEANALTWEQLDQG